MRLKDNRRMKIESEKDEKVFGLKENHLVILTEMNSIQLESFPFWKINWIKERGGERREYEDTGRSGSHSNIFLILILIIIIFPFLWSLSILLGKIVSWVFTEGETFLFSFFWCKKDAPWGFTHMKMEMKKKIMMMIKSVSYHHLHCLSFHFLCESFSFCQLFIIRFQISLENRKQKLASSSSHSSGHFMISHLCSPRLSPCLTPFNYYISWKLQFI